MNLAPALGRRTFLSGAGIAALGLGGCAPPADPPAAPAEQARKFPLVKVARDRVIRTVVGLRPFRPSGFVLREERLESKLLVHNYGHGGCGVTLSWGTAHLAVEKALAAGASRCAVLGCGAVGLATARLLQRRGREVTIYAREMPPLTTSNIAGAQWQPFTVVDRDRRTPEFSELLERSARLSHRYFQDLAGPRHGVRWVENYVFTEKPDDRYLDDPLADLYPGSRILEPGEHPFPSPWARRFSTMFIEMPVYLDTLTRDFLIAGGRVVVREFTRAEELLELEEPVILNCTGMGSRELFGDEELMPVKGQLTVLLPQPEIDYIALTGSLYMFPRADGILLGGTAERGEWSLDVNEEAEARVLEGHRRFFGGAEAAEI